MNFFTETGSLLLTTLGSVAILIVVMRFLLQLVRADFYNPISQFIVKATNPLLVPLRRVIPGYGGLDISSLLLAVAIQFVVLALLALLEGGSHIAWLTLLIKSPFMLLKLILNIYFWGLIIMVIASWVAPNSYNPALILINQILEPVMRPIRKLMPDLGGIDLSPILLFLAIQILEKAVDYTFIGLFSSLNTL